MKIELPLTDRVGWRESKVGDLMPVREYTKKYPSIAAIPKFIFGPTNTFTFRGADLGLEYDVLVQTRWPPHADPVRAYDRAYRITSETTRTSGFWPGNRTTLDVYEIETLSPEVQSRVFRAMGLP